jgi:alpha-glucosidase
MTMLRALIALILFLAAPWAHAAEPVTAASPDGSIVVSVAQDNDGRVLWSLSRRGKPLIAPSRLGFIFTDQDDLVRNLKLTAGAPGPVIVNRWEQPWGERRYVTDRHREFVVDSAQPKTGRTFRVRFRLFDDGIGFRYELPAAPGGHAWNIADELTEFVIAEDGTAWWIPGDDWNREEYLYHETPIDAVAVAQTPMTLKLRDGTHLAFHEAALVDYSGMWLHRVEGRRFKAKLQPGALGPRVTRSGAFVTPWRTIRIADSAAGLYDNDLELNLNEPNRLGAVPYVHPMKYIGIWWAMHLDKWTWPAGPRHGATTEHALHYIDFAANNGFGGLLIEGWNKGWEDWFGTGRDFSFTESYPDFDLPKIAAYAKSKGVQLIGHHETGGNIANYERQLDAGMALYQANGVHAVKTGYVADAGGIIAPGPGPDGTVREWHEGQREVQHHLRVVQSAAAHRIAVVAHEPVKDTGLRRTYPNWISREDARGQEYNAWGNPTNPPNHEATLVFTRMLSGPMDYTPGVLSLDGKPGVRIPSTLAKQLALYVALYSPVQMAADLPENLAKYPRELAFIRAVPSDWAETRTLLGEVGRNAVIARRDRNSAEWWVGGVGSGDQQTLGVPLSFLPAGKWRATLYRDGPTADWRTDGRHDIVIEGRDVTSGDRLQLFMGPGGGFALRLTPLR